MSRFGLTLDPRAVAGVLVSEERKFRELIRRGRPLLERLFPDGRLTEADYEFLRDTHGLPREVVSDLVGR